MEDAIHSKLDAILGVLTGGEAPIIGGGKGSFRKPRAGEAPVTGGGKGSFKKPPGLHAKTQPYNPNKRTKFGKQPYNPNKTKPKFKPV